MVFSHTVSFSGRMKRKKLLPLISLFSFTLSQFGAPLAAATESHFDQVDVYLDRGDVVYGYVDIDGDIERITGALSQFLMQMSMEGPLAGRVPPLPYATFIKATGLMDIQAIGLSSMRLDEGFQNKTFVLTKGAPTGLLSLGGLGNHRFSVADWAPSGSAAVLEQSLNMDALIQVAYQIADVFMGPEGKGLVDTYLEMPLPESTISVGAILHALDGQISGVLQLDQNETFMVPDLGAFPKVDFMLRFEGAAELIGQLAALPLLQAMPNYTMRETGNLTILSGFLPEAVEGFDPVIIGDQSSGDLYLVSSQAYQERCLDESGSKLKDTKVYQDAIASLPGEGTAFGYIAPEVGDALKQLISKSAAMGGSEIAFMRPYMEWSYGPLIADFPLLSVVRIEPNGLYYVSNWNVSHKRNLATLAYANPVTVGLLAAMAIPAFQKVKTTSQEKAVLNNLRQLASAADQYFLENGLNTVEVSKLIGPNAYIRSFEPVAGETYPETINMGEAIKAVFPDGRVVEVDF